MNALNLISRNRRLGLLVATACTLVAATARATVLPSPVVPPPPVLRTFDVHETAVGNASAELTIQHVTGTGPWTISGVLQSNGAAAHPIVGQMARQPQGGYALSFNYQSSAFFQQVFQGAVQADNVSDPNSPVPLAGQFFTTSPGAGGLHTITGPHPFYAISGGGGIFL